ncbi:MAG: SCO family protein [Pyrinomonadaceae bacterium]
MKLLVLAFIVCCFSPSLYGQSREAPVAPPLKETENASNAQKYFSDVVLVNQHGEQLRFYSDLLKGKVVVISSFMATCTSACPVKNRNLEKLQEAAGDRLGKDVFILSISVDPVTDTPERLKEYAKTYHAKPGWHFLTGKKENVDWALYKIGQYVPNKENHINLLVIGNESTGLWKKAFGLAKEEDLVNVFASVLNDKTPATN